MMINNPFAFGIAIGVLSTLVVEIIAIFIAAANSTRGKK